MAIPCSLASMVLLLLVTALLHLSQVARAQQDAGRSCRAYVNEDKGDSSLVGPYHNFSVSCVNDSFALLNVRETGKRDYKSVTVEMKCTNEILNTSYSRVLLNDYSPRSERNIPVRYNTNLEPGTVCVFSGCVRTSPAENSVYKYNIQEATCYREMDLFSSSATSDSSTSIMLPSSSLVSSSLDVNPSSSGISRSSTVNIISDSVSDHVISSSIVSDHVITSSITATGTILPTVTPLDSGSPISVLFFVILSAGFLIIFGIGVAFVLCCLSLVHKRFSRKNINNINFMDFEMGIHDIHHFMLDDISIAESVATIVQPLHPPMTAPKHCSLMLSSADSDSNRKGSVSVDEAAIKEIQLVKPIPTSSINTIDSKPSVNQFQPPLPLHMSKSVVIQTEGFASETKTPSTAYDNNTRHCVAPIPSLSSDNRLAADRERRYPHTLPSASTVPNNEALKTCTQEALRSSNKSNGHMCNTITTSTNNNERMYSPCDHSSQSSGNSLSNQSLTKGSVNTDVRYVYTHRRPLNEQDNTQAGSPCSYSTVSSTNNNNNRVSNCRSPASSTNESHTDSSIRRHKDNNYTYSSTLARPSLIKGISSNVSNVLTEGHTCLASSGSESLYEDSSCEGHTKARNRYDSDYVSESDYVSDSSFSSMQMEAMRNV